MMIVSHRQLKPARRKKKNKLKFYNDMEILVFRTGVADHKQLQNIAPKLNSLRGVHKWSFDLDDHEKILRIEAVGISPGEIENTLLSANYFCEELPD